MKIAILFFGLCLLFNSWSCKKTEVSVPKDNFISFIVDNKDTINFDSTANLAANFNLWKNTFYSQDPLSNYTCLMSDTLTTPSIVINVPGKTTGKFNELNRNTYVRYIGKNGTSYSGILGIYEIVISEYGKIGGQIRGEFKGVLRQKNQASSVLITNGHFSIRRSDDYPKL